MNAPDQSFLEVAEDVLDVLVTAQSKSMPCALGVVTHVSGGSARAVGTLVAIREDGFMAGYISHGCVDADLVVQSQEALKSGKSLSLIYGTGSPYLDLRLPCGGSVHVSVDPKPDPQKCAKALSLLLDRKPVGLEFNALGDFTRVIEDCEPDQTKFVAWHAPRLRLVVAGMGPPLKAVSAVAQALHIPTSIMSPDPNADVLVEQTDWAMFQHLTTQSAAIDVPIDKWTAVLLMFHDHDWETSILTYALKYDPFYVGALGSAITHAKRLQTLSDLGAEKTDLNRIKGPIGLIPAARNAQVLAISVLAEIADAYRSIMLHSKSV